MNKRTGVGAIYVIMLNKKYPVIKGLITYDGKFNFNASDKENRNRVGVPLWPRHLIEEQEERIRLWHEKRREKQE